MARYTARARLYVKTVGHLDAQLIEMGETFESNDIPGRAWFPLDAEGRAAWRARHGRDAPTSFGRFSWDTSAGMREDGRVGFEGALDGVNDRVMRY